MLNKLILAAALAVSLAETSFAQETVATRPLDAAQYEAALFPPTAPKFKVRGIQRTETAPAPASVSRPINFAYDSAAIPTAFQEELLGLVEALKSPNAEGKVLVITGHTDAHGAPDYNLALSLKRAEAVETFLVAHGVPRTKLVSTGRGMAELLPDHDGKDSLNRRVEFAAH